MMSVQELFYGEAEPIGIVNTAAAQVIRNYQQQKLDQYTPEHRKDQYTPEHRKYFQEERFNHPIHGDSPSSLQMGHKYHLLQRSPEQQSAQHQATQHKEFLQPKTDQYTPEQRKSPQQSIFHQPYLRSFPSLRMSYQYQPLHQSPPARSPPQVPERKLVNTPEKESLQPKSGQYIPEQREFSFNQPDQHNSPPVRMGNQYYQAHQNPPPVSSQHQAPQHKLMSTPQKDYSQAHIDQDNEYLLRNRKPQQEQRQRSPLQPLSQPNYHQSYHNGPLQNSHYVNHHQQSPPPFQFHTYANQQENLRHYGSPEVPVLRLKVPMCCEACEERVQFSLSAIRGVRSVECNSRTEKVTVMGSAAPADILKACKKLFKKSEMWVDRYY